MGVQTIVDLALIVWCIVFIEIFVFVVYMVRETFKKDI